MGNGNSDNKVSIGDITSKKIPSDGSDKDIRILQVRAGVVLCYISIALVGASSIIMIIYYIVSIGDFREILKVTNGSTDTELIQKYKEVSGIAVDNILRVSERIIGSILVPILTLLLGYIFGSKEAKNE
ncbi:hypothetical protein GF312_02685 [Candidatus Poribacteria bacterium]|nr:hypothetical protein [Candidatus Poribacteria bacterium]